ncbi:protein RETICULATA-RELATED 6, chloroplastic-like [Camellia sinensis]|uniref:protein RETICULATA-RELATED 6, chloroplastic-like n=1 Tax=Camellia sinensis TaxID=4442 RepID=UPI001035D77D|nr:protein RETICULATA-RELATED 6, chloroplastic-like [Camellia sinensis]
MLQGFRERLLADPKFLHRLAIEEAISITTTLLAQYERHKENFFEELDYVITDTVRGSVVDFFTIWFPAPTLSFLSIRDTIDTPDNMEALKGLLGSIPDNAFQRNIAGKDWNVNHRVASVLFGGLKLAGVGFISSIGTAVASNILYAVRKLLNPALDTKQRIKRSPILKTAVVYGGFLGTSANLRYQTRNTTRLVALAIAAGLGALTHTLGTVVPVILASGFATVTTAIVIGTVVGSFI